MKTNIQLKSYTNIKYRKALTALLILMLFSCNRIDLDELKRNENNQQQVTTTMTLKPRVAENAEIPYPLYIYAFDTQTGNLICYQQFINENTPTTLNINTGNYTIVALSGIEHNQAININNIDATYTLPEVGYATTPIMMGTANVTITKDATLTMTLYNQVAAIEIALYDIPQHVTDVTCSFSPLHATLSVNGKTSGTCAASIPLEYVGDHWQSQTIYTLPGSDKYINITITTLDQQGQTTYSYTTPTTFKANTPYFIQGSYTEGISLNNSINIGGWNPSETIDFTFGNNNSENLESTPTDTTSQMPTLVTDHLPTDAEVINGHFVAVILPEAFSETATALLLSKKEWQSIPSANHATDSAAAINALTEYCEGELQNWTIPTKEETDLISGTIGTFYISETNNILSENGFPILSYGELKSEKIRYLCNDGKSSVDWESGRIQSAGEKRTYHLRAVKKVKIKVANQSQR